MSAARNYFAWQARLVKPEIGRRVVEVGCGIGNFTQAMLDREAVLGVDIDGECLETWRSRYPHLIPMLADVTNLPMDELGRFQPDSCVCLNVLEHVDDDAAALRAMASALPADGVIVLLVPAFQSLQGAIDRNLGHRRRYTRDSMTRLAAGAGLRIRKLRYMNLAGFFGWWLNARVLKREAHSKAQIAFADRIAIPLTSRLEALIAPPFGQSLFCVLTKS